ALIEKLLDAGAQAPNHHKVQPWRFIVLTGAARERLGGGVGQTLLKRQPDAPAEVGGAGRAKAPAAPGGVPGGGGRPNGPRVREVENVCAAAGAVENMLLAATALGLGAQWRTGAAAEEPEVKRFLGLAPDQHLISFVYVGWCMVDPQGYERPSFA